MTYSPKRTPRKSFLSKLRVVGCISLLALLAGCATTTQLTDTTLGISEQLPAKIAIYFKKIVSNRHEHGAKEEDYQEYIQEIFTQVFSEVEVVNELEDVEETRSIAIVLIDFDSSTGMFINSRAKIRFLDTNGQELFSGRNNSSTPNWWNSVDDHRNAAIATFTPLIRNLSQSGKVLSYIRSKPALHYAAKFTKPSRVLIYAKADSTPPSIVITSHKIKRGVYVVDNSSRTEITGRAVDPSGVVEVKLNGESIFLDAEGNFKGDIFLRVGENKVVITAMDTQQNFVRKDFVIKRNPKTTMVRKDEVTGQKDFGRFYALIIGNNNYQHLPKLETARNDAKSLEKILREKYGFETEVLLDAKRDEILERLNKIRKRLEQSDSFLLYYAGHGEFDKSSGKTYWLPVDAKLDDDTKWILADRITSNIKRFASNHILIVADSCYSGTMTRSLKTDVDTKGTRNIYLKKMLNKPSRTLIASGGNEPVTDIGGEGHSVFAQVFLKALNSVEDKVFTAEELFYGYLKEAVAGRSEQTPEYSIIRNSGHEGGDFLFVRE